MASRVDARNSVAEKRDRIDGGIEFAQFVDQELDFEMRRSDRAEAQGQRLVSASSALVTLAFAGSAVVAGQAGLDPPRLTVWSMIPATLFLLLAAWFGIRTSRVTSIQRASVALLRRWDKSAEPTTMWRASSVEARAAVTDAKITALESIRQANNKKLSSAKWGGRAQGAGLLFLAVASVAILLHSAVPHEHWWLNMLRPVSE